MKRVVIIGTTGSGKSTVAERLAPLLGGTAIDLDALNWGPNWTPAPLAILRERVEVVLDGDRWVVAGNYSALRDVVWSRADTLVWLDYPLPLIFWRLLRRTLRRILLREELWGGNRETMRKQFASRDSLFLWAVKTHFRRRHEIPVELARPDYAHLHVAHFHRPGATERWLNEIPVP